MDKYPHKCPLRFNEWSGEFQTTIESLQFNLINSRFFNFHYIYKFFWEFTLIIYHNHFSN